MQEVLLGMIYNHIWYDPLAAIVYTRFRDARRLMRKSAERYAKAEELFKDVPWSPRGNLYQGTTGPVNGMHQAAAMLGVELRIDVDNDFVLDCKDGTPNLHLVAGGNRSWQSAVVMRIRQGIMRNLHTRLKAPHELGGDEDDCGRKKRKDLYGIGDWVNIFST